MALISDLIELPERVAAGDFVLRLSEGVGKPDQTLDEYVVTPQLAKAFGDALGLIKSALEGKRAQAAFLHGSFGSGKSHFMAVLYLILQGNVRARSIPELAPVIARFAPSLEGQKFLTLPFHMIGAKSLESAILGGYAERVRQLHPQAEVPGIYLGDRLIDDACRLRTTMGDAAFFGKLNDGADEGGWGKLAGGGWTAESFEAAAEASDGDPERARLVGRLVETIFTAVGDMAFHGGDGFVNLDTGLSVISRHAKSLGYSAVVLFLDELILWLASHAADPNFLTQEAPKLVKLVEGQAANRPIPLISFVARQRNLSDLVGETFDGVSRLNFDQGLQYVMGRFATINLEDRNLPAIVEHRVLKPRSQAARQQIDDEFERTQRERPEILRVLLTSKGTPEDFRRVYPFSPALVDTLVALSSLLQRERTAIKVMLQLLVDRRDTLQLGQIVPVGDLFDLMADGDEPFTDVMRAHFDSAKKLYREKLLPIIESESKTTKEEAAANPNAPEARRLMASDRLLKTLLLSALAPEAEALKGLTAQRLAALNHGEIRSPIPGREAESVLLACRRWAAEAGQIKLGGDPQNPIISVQLSGVNVDPIIDAAGAADNPGNRQQKVRELLFEELKVDIAQGLFQTREVVWRGTPRAIDVVFGNVREMAEETLRAPNEQWRVVIDYPFDERNYGPADDRANLDRYRQANPSGTRTVAWLPSFLSLAAQKELGRLVVLDYLLKTDDRFETNTANLSAVDRQSARVILENQRDQLRLKIKQALAAAYGVIDPAPNALDPALIVSPHVLSLEPSFQPGGLVGADLAAAFEHLVDQALTHQYPDHPVFPEDARFTPNSLKKVWEKVSEAAANEDRTSVESALRAAVDAVVRPLQIGEVPDSHLGLKRFWETHFTRCHAAAGSGTLTVEKLRAYMDQDRPRGLPRALQNLVIRTFAAQTNKVFRWAGTVYSPRPLDDLPDDVELKDQPLPKATEWDAARGVAAGVFGVSVSSNLSGTNLNEMTSKVAAVIDVHREASAELIKKLGPLVKSWCGDGSRPRRLQTAEATMALIDRITAAREDALGAVAVMAGAAGGASPDAMGSSLKKAGAVVGAIETTNWALLEGMKAIAGNAADPRQNAAARILGDVAQAIAADEFAVGLGGVLGDAVQRATKLVVPTTSSVGAAAGEAVGGYGAQAASTKRTELRASGRAGAEDLLDELRRRLPSDDDFDVQVLLEITRPARGKR